MSINIQVIFLMPNPIVRTLPLGLSLENTLAEIEAFLVDNNKLLPKKEYYFTLSQDGQHKITNKSLKLNQLNFQQQKGLYIGEEQQIIPDQNEEGDIFPLHIVIENKIDETFQIIGAHLSEIIAHLTVDRRIRTSGFFTTLEFPDGQVITIEKNFVFDNQHKIFANKLYILKINQIQEEVQIKQAEVKQVQKQEAQQQVVEKVQEPIKCPRREDILQQNPEPASVQYQFSQNPSNMSQSQFDSSLVNQPEYVSIYLESLDFMFANQSKVITLKLNVNQLVGAFLQKLIQSQKIHSNIVAYLCPKKRNELKNDKLLKNYSIDHSWTLYLGTFRESELII